MQQYNEMTPHELNLHILEYSQKNKQDHEERIMLAYMTAYWGRVKKMPDLKKLLGQKDKPKKEQTAEDMLAQVKKLNAAFGGATNYESPGQVAQE